MSSKIEKSWNPVLNLVKKVKFEFIKKYGELYTIHFETWLGLLNKEEYNKLFEPLQFNQEGKYLLIRYGISDMQRGMWEDPKSIYRECRSIVLDLEEESIVIAPFRKFFNLNEVEENTIDVIEGKFKNAETIDIMDKLDGSMQNARYYDEEIKLFGSMALNDNDSWRLQQGRKLLTKHHKRMIKSTPNITFIFEYVSPSNLHVVPYKKQDEGMYLIGARDVRTGEMIPQKSLDYVAGLWGIDRPKRENKSLNELLEEMKTAPSTEREGWVISLDDHMVKIKCDDYVNIHRILDRASSVNVVIQSIAEDTFDDLYSKIPNNSKERVSKIYDLVVDYVTEAKKDIKYWYDITPKETRKDFMIFVDNSVPKHLRKYVRMEYLGEDYNVLSKGKNSYKKMKDLGYSEEQVALYLGG